MKGRRRAAAFLWAVIAPGAAPAQTPAIAPVTPVIPADLYTPGRALIADLDRVVTSVGVQESFLATLGGARQYVSVRGADRGNPILVFVHGGPASVELPIAWSFQRPWEDYFTVVQWDQRGAGKSFALNDPAVIAATLTPGRYVDDTIALIELLRARYGKRKVFLLGHSWGSTVGLAVAARRPDLLYAYVGMGQLIDFRENEAASYQLVLAQARADHNARAIAELARIAPYPGGGPLDVARTAVERTWSVHYGGLAAGRSDVDFYTHLGRLSPEYGSKDREAWDDGSAFTMSHLWPTLATLSLEGIRRLDVPVLLFLGRHDTTTPPAIAAAWLSRLSAPAKRIVWFANSAHLPMLEEPGRMLEALIANVRPIAGHDLPAEAGEMGQGGGQATKDAPSPGR